MVTEIERNKSTITEAVAEAESRTSGEILVCVMRQAGHYGHETGALGLVGGLVLFLVAWLVYPAWTVERSWTTLLFGLGLFAGGYLLMQLAPGLAVMVAPSQSRRQQAEEMAAVQFHRMHVENTRAHTGVLIFVAEAERMVVVLGDAPISLKVQAADWEGVRDAILAGIRSGQFAEGICTGVRLAGDLLARHFPAGEHDRNELPNEPLIIR